MTLKAETMALKPPSKFGCSGSGPSPQRSVGVAARSIGHSQFAPPPLTEQLAILLNFQSHVKHLLDGFFETVEVVVNQTCDRQRA